MKFHFWIKILFISVFLLFNAVSAYQLFPLGTLGAREYGPETRVEAVIIPITGDIEPSLTVFIRRAIQFAEKKSADIAIFEINTFGGRVDSALQIATLIGGISEIQSIAFIPAEPESLGVSWSAGALISFACDAIYMAPGTSIGAAAPVYQTQTGMQMAEEKTVSAVRAQLAALAEKNGYPVGAALAMVDQDIELVELIQTDSVILLERSDAEQKLADSLNETEGVADRIGKVISPAGKLLTLTAGEMHRYGISSGTPGNLDELLMQLNVDNASVARYEPSLADKIVALITSTLAASTLILIGTVALYLEISSPGFGLPGTVAILCFAVTFVAGGLLGTLGSLELLIFLVGLVLLAVEIFLIPGFGITGITGFACIAVSLVLSRQDFFIPKWDWQSELLRKNLLLVSGSLFGGIAVIALLLVLFPKLKPFQRLVLSSPLPAKGPDASAFPAEEPESSFIGKRGIVLTALRPVGKAQFDEEVLIVEALGEFIEKGEEVVVLNKRGNHFYVERHL